MKRYKDLKPISYPPQYQVQPVTKPIRGTFRVPGSKSLTNRALILAALAEGTSTLTGALASDDTAVMIDSLQRLGFTVTVDEAEETITVAGQGGHIPAEGAELFVGNSGTSIRFLTALTALGRGEFVLDGVPRMRERPQGDLIDALNDWKVAAFAKFGNGCPPIVVEGAGEIPGGTAHLNASASSQFLSALLMVAPYAQKEVTLEIRGQLRPFYVDITRRMMAQWGVQAPTGNNRKFWIPTGQKYAPQNPYPIEPDASSASYLFAAAALTGGSITLPNLSANALQGDVRFATEVLVEMGCTVETNENSLTLTAPANGELRGIERDMSAISDTSLTLAAIAPFATSPTTIKNIAHSRLQECDRVSAVCTELTRLGVQVEERPDGLTVYPCTNIQPATIQTYHDHRVAMSFALVGLRVSGIVIDNPSCVAKTFPNYWQVLESLQNSP